MRKKQKWPQVPKLAIEMANNVISQLKWLPSGTFTAGEIHSILRKVYGLNYHRKQLPETINTDWKGYNLVTTPQGDCHQISVNGERMNITPQNVFFIIKKLEQSTRCGLRKKRHVWTIPPQGQLLYTFHIKAFSKDAMNALSRYHRYDGRDISPVMDMITGSYTDPDKWNDLRLYMDLFQESDENGQCSSYPIPDNLYIYYNDCKIKHFYGTCEISLYVDASTMKYTAHLTNQDGYKISLPVRFKSQPV